MDKKLMGNIIIGEYSGEGVSRIVESGEWFVGIKNYKPANDVESFTFMEKHLLTDEVFVLLEGHCVLLVDASEDSSCSDVKYVSMEKNKIYCIKKGIWHNTIVTKDVKMALIENSNTSMENSELYNFSEVQINNIKTDLKTSYFK